MTFEQAKAVLEGFVQAYGPALAEMELGRTLDRMREILIGVSFREVSLLALEWQMRSSHMAYEQYRLTRAEASPSA